MIKKWLYGYQFVAVQVTTLVLMLLALNVLLAAFYQYKDEQLKETNPIAQKYGIETLAAVYPGYNQKQIDALLTETWTRKQEFESFTGFKEASYRGRYLNVHAAGFRIGSEQGAWPLDTSMVNVVVFGGSTTFGYGVADGETIPSYLQAALQKSISKVRCYNFGRGYYYSSQERALFEKLLLDGVKPDAVIFIDGLNEYFQPEPEFEEETKNLFAQKPGTMAAYWWQNISLSRLVRSIRYRITGISPEAEEQVFSCKSQDLQKIHNRYWLNRKMNEAIAQQANIPSYFVWQPISCFKYTFKDDYFMTVEEAKICYPACGYQQMKQEWSARLNIKNQLWLADMQQNRKENLYVDKVHYAAAFNAEIADSIANFLINKNPQWNSK